MLEEIRVKKAAQHNLKQIDVSLPRNKMIVITGPSGSGKSSLAFDTLFAEGQRRYIDCLSTYARQFIEQMEKPAVESIEGLSPSISIDQKTISSNPRSTVGTITEIYDLLRLLFARLGTPHCPNCGKEVSAQTAARIVESILSASAGQTVKIFSPVIKGRKGEYHQLLERLRKKGYLRARINGVLEELEESIWLEKSRPHTIEVLVDVIKIAPSSRVRLKPAVDKALEISEGGLLVLDGRGRENYYSLKLVCPDCEIGLPELEPRNFSFNSPYGACPACHGLGHKTAENEWGEVELTDDVCPLCGGARLKKESLSVTVEGKSISDLADLAVSRLDREIAAWVFSRSKQPVADKIIKEIRSRIEVLNQLGMSYLQLSRTTASLSGGEAQRIRLAAQVGAKLRGVLYVLDEPTIGLHQRDNGRLISLLKSLRDEGNSIIVVEHDEQTIRSADYILDLGPGAGENGGEKVAEGPLPQILASPRSLTAQYLRGEKHVPIPALRKKPESWLTVLKARTHNLKNIDVRLPLSVMTAVTGVSGSGKSTLVFDVLYQSLVSRLGKNGKTAGKGDELAGAEKIDKVISVDQKPIGRTPRSNPATYTGLFTALRDLFARTPEARSRGYGPGRFSFNVSGGRCEECQGAGVKKIEMHFLPDVFVTCDRCGGMRYNKETLAVAYKGKNIADFLAMTVDDAYEFLKAHPVLKKKLAALKRVGLGYIRLGQPAPALSGGEAQRIKLTRELSRKNTGRTLYLLDEPTTGLHFDDVRKLLEVLAELVGLGNTVVIIEHNLEVIKYCDYIIDLGPEGGEEGGRVVAQGKPEDVAAAKGSHTGRFLKEALSRYRREAEGR